MLGNGSGENVQKTAENMSAEQILFFLIRAVICRESSHFLLMDNLSAEKMEQVYLLAQRHDLAHFVGVAIEREVLPERVKTESYRQAKQKAIFRYARLDYEYERICRVLEAACIPFMPLKGAVMRSYYPEAWMRTSCDIDILIPENQLNSAAALLESNLQYIPKAKGNHDLTLVSENGTHLELHYLAIDKGQYMAAQNLLCNIWEVAEPKAPHSFHYIMPDEWFYFYHIAHMAKHFENGGCGIRSVMDLWILNQRVSCSREKRDLLLEQGELCHFGREMEKVAQMWFSDGEADPVTEKVAEYIIRGGTYGNQKNLIGVQQTRVGGKFRYAIHKIFLPYEVICKQYPILKKIRILTPVFEVVRWLKLLLTGGIGRSLRELYINCTISHTEQSELEMLLKALQLKR